VSGEDPVWRFGKLDSEFHICVAEASGNRMLPKLISEVMRHSQRFWCLMTPGNRNVEVTLQEHQAIQDAIESGHSDQAEQSMRDHIEHAMERHKL